MIYYNQQANPLITQIFGNPTLQSVTNMPQPDEKQLAQLYSIVSTIDKQGWQQLIQQAKARGISDEQIKQGLETLLNHR